MGKAWILDTETKGTGAQMVPLENVETKPESKLRPTVVRPKPRRASRPPEPRGPRRFKVVDVMTEQALAKGTAARETVDVLEGVRSVVDVSIYEWQERDARWRRLTRSERRAFWALRDRR